VANWSIGSNVYTNDPLNEYGESDYDVNGVNLSGRTNRYDKKRNFNGVHGMKVKYIHHHFG